MGASSTIFSESHPENTACILFVILKMDKRRCWVAIVDQIKSFSNDFVAHSVAFLHWCPCSGWWIHLPDWYHTGSSSTRIPATDLFIAFCQHCSWDFIRLLLIHVPLKFNIYAVTCKSCKTNLLYKMIIAGQNWS